MVGCQRAAALGDDIGLTQIVFLAGVDEGRHGVVGILLNRIVHRALAGTAAGAVIVDTQAAADVDKVDVEAHLRELDIELRGLAQGVLDAAYHRHLAADVEVYQLEAVLDVMTLEDIESLEQLRRIEAELRLVAAALLPFARA